MPENGPPGWRWRGLETEIARRIHGASPRPYWERSSSALDSRTSEAWCSVRGGAALSLTSCIHSGWDGARGLAADRGLVYSLRRVMHRRTSYDDSN